MSDISFALTTALSPCYFIQAFKRHIRAIAQVVSVQVWGTWGRQFESGLPDYYFVF
ncbi:hypothetical protein SPIRO4BDMA_50364 [uncultured spirochete]|uniref:Uncharacterized protein n=1 Tax=uncultured spirochete TaxID=156406 RepID=A0A3P3XRZ6_9SPIR|nr:hypothetical protein SPIRO4BDMA_50364 [uncultured spirochete]